MREKAKKRNITLGIVALLLVVTIGYATLQTNLTINGTSKINNSTWNVHFNNPSAATTGSVAIDTSTYADAHAARKDSATQVSFNVLLSEPGDFYEFTVDVENTGSIDAMLDSISSKIKIGSGEEVEIIPTGQNKNIPSYLDYSVAYSDGTPIEAKQELLGNGGIETVKVRVEFKTDIEANDLPQTDQTISFKFQMNYVQKNDTSTPVPHPGFDNATSWETIISMIQSGDTSSFEIGDTKTVDLGTLGTHTLRVANTSTPPECSTTGFSQTACGFVLEFADIITEHRMNRLSNSGNTNGDGNKGGWEYSEMRAYLNSNIYNALPTVIKDAIINTTVVSGHGSKDSTNFTTTDKLYLLSVREVYNSGSYDTAKGQTRQLDYYESIGVTASSYSGAIKQKNGTNSWWWLRSAISDSYGNFFTVISNGSNGRTHSFDAGGASPAFRIG